MISLLVLALVIGGGALYVRAIQHPIIVEEPGGGVRFGFIRSVSGNDGTSIAFDEARWIVGDEARHAAVAAGVCGADEEACPPNDYFIVNDATTTVELPLAQGVTIAIVDASGAEPQTEKTISPKDFAALINDVHHPKNIPYQLYVEHGLVTIIEETYVP